MADSALMVLCPSRGRPDEAFATYQSFLANRTESSTFLRFVIDNDDPEFERYTNLPFQALPAERTGNMVKALNSAALDAAPYYDIIGFIGDDHRFRTKGWDLRIAEEIESMGAGFVYADDLAQRANLPTQVFISSKIIQSLGWMGLPSCTHLYIDNAWKVLGQNLDRLHYLPDVVIEHLHPAYGKGSWDEGHVRVNTGEMYNHDSLAFEAWMRSTARDDIARVRAIL